MPGLEEISQNWFASGVILKCKRCGGSLLWEDTFDSSGRELKCLMCGRVASRKEGKRFRYGKYEKTA